MGVWAARGTAVGALVCALAVATTGFAQSEESARQAARKLGNEGIELYEQGEFASAEDRLERAFRVIQVPTLGLWLARARAKNGKLVEASELYLEVSRMSVEPGAPDVLREAVADAAKEREALDPRIPSLTITLQEGEDTAGIEISMDGNDLRSALLDVPIPVNPGRHEFEVRRRGKKLRGEVELTEGEQRAVALTFRKEPDAGPPASPATPAPGSPALASAPTSTATTASTVSPGTPQDAGNRGNGQRIAAFAMLGVGGAGLAAGGVLGGLAISQRDDLDNSGGCVGERCSTQLQSDVDDYNAMRLGSTIGFAVGGVGVATGVTLLLTAPKRRQARQQRLEPWMGLSEAGIRGRF
jgi:hypothetical protein